MTLIAGFKSTEGYVLCADSQETVEIGTKRKKDEYRVTAQKITPERFGNYDLALAGAGDGDVIEAFIQRLRDNMQGMQITSVSDLKEHLQNELREFQNTETGGYSKSEKRFSLLVGARSCDNGSCALWRSHVARLVAVKDCQLIGYEDARYIDAMTSLYPKDGSATDAQCIFLGLYLMWLAANTSNYIRDPISVVLVRREGLLPQEQATIAKLQQRVVLFHAQFDKVFLACADTGLQPGEFSTKVREFIETIVSLRRDYVAESVGDMVAGGLDKVIEHVNLVPLGTTIVTVPMSGDQLKGEQERQQRTAEQLRKDFPQDQDVERVIANLHALRDALQKHLNGEPADDIGMALTEINRAALMLPFKLDQKAWERVWNVMNVIPTSMEEHQNPRLQKASMSLRIAVIDQALAVIEPTRSTLEERSKTP